MSNIDAIGIQAAELTDEQITQLRKAEQSMNDESGNSQKIYLLAVTRP